MLVTIDVTNNSVLSLLRDMERLELIHVQSPATNAPHGKLSERFAGALHLSDEEYNELQNTLQKDRAEWTRNIY
jgi:hypothetical protein